MSRGRIRSREFGAVMEFLCWVGKRPEAAFSPEI
jgi:hypothetical protein